MFDKDAIHVSKKELDFILTAVESYHALAHTLLYDPMLNSHERRVLKKNVIRAHSVMQKLRGDEK